MSCQIATGNGGKKKQQQLKSIPNVFVSLVFILWGLFDSFHPNPHQQFLHSLHHRETHPFGDDDIHFVHWKFDLFDLRQWHNFRSFGPVGSEVTPVSNGKTPQLSRKWTKYYV